MSSGPASRRWKRRWPCGRKPRQPWRFWGILPQIREAGTTFGGMALRDEAGTALLAPGVRGVLGISRADLIRILDAAVPGSQCTASTGRVEEIPATGPLTSGLLVGADGVHSVVRRGFWGARSQARLTPYLALRGVLPVPVRADSGGEYWGRGQLFGITPASGGRTYWYASFRSTSGRLASTLRGRCSRQRSALPEAPRAS